MIKHTQNKLVIKDKNNNAIQIGNCYQTVIACLLDLPINQVPNVETLFDIEDSTFYQEVMDKFLESKGYELYNDYDLKQLSSRICNKQVFDKYKDKFYLVSGKSNRGTYHICIYKNGELYWDTHPSRDGISEPEIYQILEKI